MIFLDVACNDPSNGLMLGYASELSIGDTEFECLGQCKFHEGRDFIKIRGKKFPLLKSKDWVGNWCWNRYLLGSMSVSNEDAMVDFVSWLKLRGAFACTSAPSFFMDWFEGKNQHSEDQIKTILTRGI